jgi:hypothetical protein
MIKNLKRHKAMLNQPKKYNSKSFEMKLIIKEDDAKKRKNYLDKTFGSEAPEIGFKDPFGGDGINAGEGNPDFPQLTEMYYYYSNSLVFKLNDTYGVMHGTDDMLIKFPAKCKVNFNWDKYLEPISYNACIRSLATKGICAPFQNKYLLFKLNQDTIDVQEIPFEQSTDYFKLPDKWMDFLEIIQEKPMIVSDSK